MKMRIRREHRNAQLLLVCACVLGWGWDAVAQVRQDGRFISRLRWTSPHGEQPGTPAEYRQRHPMQPACFSEEQVFAPPSGGGLSDGGSASLSLLVDAALYPNITTGLNQYTADLSTEGYSVYLQTLAGRFTWCIIAQGPGSGKCDIWPISPGEGCPAI